MAGPDDVPSSTDIFLKRSSAGRRKPVGRTSAPGLFDALPVPEPEPAGMLVRAVVTETRVEVPIPSAQVEALKVWTVGALVREVRGQIEARYARVTVEGEVSNWRPAASGHCYFTLKDGAAQLSVVMFRREAGVMRFKPKDGDQVRLRGQLSVYESRGQMQLIAETMELAGIGAQLAAVQELKARLKREGLFENKRPLPAFPKCIGVVTSLHGAALRDIVKVCRRRHAAVNLLVYPAVVQGPRCAVEVAAGLRWFTEHPSHADVVIVARGGGSWEDLHGFDDERVARAIAGCGVPVVVGVGHATDSTIADAAADDCAPTPSAAAELVTAAQHTVEERVKRIEDRLRRAGSFEMLRVRQRISGLSAEAVLRRLEEGLRRRSQRVDELEFGAQKAVGRALRTKAARVQELEGGLARQHPAVRLANDQRRLELMRGRVERAGEAVVSTRMERVREVRQRADAMSPLRVLERGYALVYGPAGLLVSADGVREGEEIVARLAKGSLRATVVG